LLATSSDLVEHILPDHRRLFVHRASPRVQSPKSIVFSTFWGQSPKPSKRRRLRGVCDGGRATTNRISRRGGT
jgi:hypothetical protein